MLCKGEIVVFNLKALKYRLHFTRILDNIVYDLSSYKVMNYILCLYLYFTHTSIFAEEK